MSVYLDISLSDKQRRAVEMPYRISVYSNQLTEADYNLCNLDNQSATFHQSLHRWRKRGLWQTVEIQMKCRRVRHFTRVYTVCWD